MRKLTRVQIAFFLSPLPLSYLSNISQILKRFNNWGKIYDYNKLSLGEIKRVTELLFDFAEMLGKGT